MFVLFCLGFMAKKTWQMETGNSGCLYWAPKLAVNQKVLFVRWELYNKGFLEQLQMQGPEVGSIAQKRYSDYGSHNKEC